MTREPDLLAELAGEFLHGSGPVDLEQAVSILKLLASVGGGTRRPSDEPVLPPTSGGPAADPRGGDEDKALRFAEARYRALVEQIPAVVFVASLEGGLSDIYVSPQIESLLGFTQAEWASSPVLWFRQLHPEDRPTLSREFAKACINGQPFRGIVRVFTKDGRLVWVHGEARLVRDDRGRPLFLQGVAFDITEQQRAQETRQELVHEQQARAEADRERTRLHEMFTNLPAAIFVFRGADQRIEFLNPVAAGVIGAGPEVLGKPWRDAFPEATKEADLLDRAFVTGVPITDHDWMLRLPGWDRDRFFDFVAQPLRDAQGAVTGVLTHSVDVTEPREARAAVDAAAKRNLLLAHVSRALGSSLDQEATLNELTRLVVPEIADWVLVDVVQPDGSLQTAAVRHADDAGSHPAERPAATVSPSGAIARVVSRGRAVFAAVVDEPFLKSAARDAEHLAALRRLGLLSCLIVPMRARGRVQGALTLMTAGSARRYAAPDQVVAEDIAQRAALAIDNARLYHEAQLASRLKDEFLATLSHELRTPLNAIVGWAHLLRSAPDPSKTAKAIDTILRNAQVQNQLISDILDVSRIIAGKMALKVTAVELGAVVEAAVDTVRPAAQAKDIRLDPILDVTAGPVSGDPDRLQQVLWNLLANAIKFTPRGGRVQVRLEAIDSHVEVTVEDDGPGIDPEFLPFVFDRFRQADSSSTRRHGGLGLGLAIVRHLVELHGGTVQAANRSGPTGAMFTVKLPRRSLAAEPPGGRERHPAVESTVTFEQAPSLKGIRVLVVDDAEDARELVSTALERCGAKATTAASVAEAYEKLRRGGFDVLIADIEMPDEDGYDLIRSVRKLPARQGGSIPAAALTAYASAADRMKILDAGFEMHVPKPVQPAELAAVVASLARSRGRRR